MCVCVCVCVLLLLLLVVVVVVVVLPVVVVCVMLDPIKFKLNSQTNVFQLKGKYKVGDDVSAKVSLTRRGSIPLSF